MRPMGTEPARLCAHVSRAIEVGLVMLALVAVASSCAESVEHDEILAAKSALEFSRVTFLDKDAEKGYELLSGGAPPPVAATSAEEAAALLLPLITRHH